MEAGKAIRKAFDMGFLIGFVVGATFVGINAWILTPNPKRIARLVREELAVPPATPFPFDDGPTSPSEYIAIEDLATSDVELTLGSTTGSVVSWGSMTMSDEDYSRMVIRQPHPTYTFDRNTTWTATFTTAGLTVIMAPALEGK
jgi:hypothetical protein